MKVYILIENWEKDYQPSNGYVNSVYADKEKALKAAKRLMKGEDNYTCKVVEREMF